MAMDKNENPASVGAGQEREEKFEFSGLITIPDILGSSAELTLLGTLDNDIQTGTLRITDNDIICAIRESGSAH